MVGTSGEDGAGQNAEKKMGIDTRGQKTKGKTEEKMGGVGGGLSGKMSATKNESAKEKRNSAAEGCLEKEACAADRMKNPSWERKKKKKKKVTGAHAWPHEYINIVVGA